MNIIGSALNGRPFLRLYHFHQSRSRYCVSLSVVSGQQCIAAAAAAADVDVGAGANAVLVIELRRVCVNLYTLRAVSPQHELITE